MLLPSRRIKTHS